VRLADACLPITATRRAPADQRAVGVCDLRQLDATPESGNRTAKREPVLSDDSSDTVPPCVCATHDAMANPRPAPLVAEARRSRSDR